MGWSIGVGLGAVLLRGKLATSFHLSSHSDRTSGQTFTRTVSIAGSRSNLISTRAYQSSHEADARIVDSPSQQDIVEPALAGVKDPGPATVGLLVGPGSGLEEG